MSNYFIWALIKPSQLILYAALLGAVFWRRPIGRWVGFVALALIIGLGVLPTATLLMWPLEGRFPAPTAVDDVDGIIVLSGSERAELSEYYGEPQLSAHGDRLTTFLSLAGRHPQARLVHSGGGTKADYSQSDAARAIILGAGVEPGRVLFEQQSRNTCESARLTKELVMPAAHERWLLVTSASHMPRAVACFRAVDWEITAYPTDFMRGERLFAFSLVDNLGDVDLAMHEWIGLVYYRLRGRTQELFPRPRR